MRRLQQYTIYWCNLESTFGHQIKKTRPCVIISPDEMNESLATVIIAPLTSTIRKFPFYLPVKYQDHSSAIACDQIKTIDKRRVGEIYADLTSKDAAALSSILTTMFRADFR
jgi:mRNA interferase MazF